MEKTPDTRYDSITCILDINDARRVLSCPDLVTVVTVTGRNGRQTHVRRLGNLSVKVSEHTVKVSGSLARWYRGDNVRLLFGEAYLDALDQLSTTLNANFHWHR